MGYRGEDLDLRTPQTWSATPADLAGTSDTSGLQNGPRGYRGGPIWVDDTVLACSNHAFEVALAHRAGEVRIEHLLNALTRIDAAAEALEARGVRVASLRRDSAAIIASDIPVGLPNGKGVPRRSEEFADVLRLAASAAARRNAPAGIEDVLNVLFDQRADFSASGLLQRNMARVVRETVEPLPPLTRYMPEPPRYQAPLQIENRPMKPEPRYVPEAPRYMPEAPRYSPEPPRAIRSEPAATPVDMMQNNRIEALEQVVRSLGNDLAGERQVVSGLLKDLSRETQAQRDDQGRLHTGLYDRLQNIERNITDPRMAASPVEGLVEQLQAIEGGLEQRLNDMSRSWTVLSDRLQALELAVRNASGDTLVSSGIIDQLTKAIDLKPIANRLDIIEEALLAHVPGGGGGDGVVTDRLKSLEGEIARALAANTASTSRMEGLLAGFERQKGDLAGQLAGPIAERVTALTSSYQSQQAGQNTALTAAVSKMADRVDAVERAVAAEIETAAAKHQAYAKDLGEVHDALMKLNQNQHTLAGSIDQWHSESAGDLSVISNRLGALNTDNDKPMQAIGALTSQMDTMSKTLVERYHRRNRFWYWLFGTDDWIGTSWPSQIASVEAERQRLKFTKKV